MTEYSKYTIGQMASLAGISSQTLRHYDKINLLKPAIIDENNGYRYYTSNQIIILNVINDLKELGFSLQKIKSYLKRDNLDHSFNLLVKQNKKISNKIAELQQKKERIVNIIEFFNTGLSQQDEYNITLKDIPQRQFAFTRYCYTCEIDYYQVVLKINKLIKIIQERELTILSKPILIPSKKDKFIDICFQINCKYVDSDFIKLVPEGKYVSIYHKGEYDNFNNSYELLYEWINNNSYKAIGNPVKILIVDVSLTENPKDYITEIQIKVEK